MTALISAQAQGQTAPTVCDRSCYAAVRELCECVCRGENHGVGLKAAYDNTVDVAKATAWLDDFLASYGGDEPVMAVNHIADLSFERVRELDEQAQVEARRARRRKAVKHDPTQPRLLL